jgi:hypothetical protein
MVGEGRETGGAGSAKMTMLSKVSPLEGGGALVVVSADIESALTTTSAFYLNCLFAFAPLYGNSSISFYPLTKFITCRTADFG